MRKYVTVVILSGFIMFAAPFVDGRSGAFAQGTPEQQQACTPDVYRLCGQFIPNADRITICLKENRAQLQKPCHDVFFKRPEIDTSRERRTSR